MPANTSDTPESKQMEKELTFALDAARQGNHRPLHALVATERSLHTSMALMDKVENTVMSVVLLRKFEDACKSANLVDLDLFIASEAHDHAARDGAMRPLHHAASNLFTAGLQRLLQAGADVNVTDDKGRTPLACLFIDRSMHPSSYLVVASIKTLIAAGGRPNLGDAWSKTPLHRAAELAESSAVQALLQGGANVDAADCNQRTPLIELLEMASLYPRRKVMKTLKILLAAGANPNAPGNGYSPMHYSCEMTEMPEVQELLVQHGGL